MVTGTESTVGLTAVTLGGGYGRLNSRFGLASDTLISAEVVLADGSSVTASEQDDTELFWAIRGGGGNFGVVTSMTMEAYRVPSVLTGTIFIPLASAKEGLLALQESFDDADDHLSILSALMTSPSGERGLVLAPMWTGERTFGERRLSTLAKFPGARVLAQGWSPYRNTFDKKLEDAWPKGRGYRMGAHNIERFDETVAEALVECAHRFTSDADCLLLHDFHGAGTRVATDATAFPLRCEHVSVLVLAGYDPGRSLKESEAVGYVRQVERTLSPLAIRGGYPNILGPAEHKKTKAFYGEASQRLTQAKARYDPENRFCSNTGIF